jgi:hypothetical protein
MGPMAAMNGRDEMGIMMCIMKENSIYLKIIQKYKKNTAYSNL